MDTRLTNAQAREQLLLLLRKKSVMFGDFLLASGARSTFYIDCRLTTFDPRGAWLTGQVMYELIRSHQSAHPCDITAVGGLTMGADPVALAIGMHSYVSNPAAPFQVFSVRKTPKSHGQTKLVEGNFKSGDSVVVLDDVITRGESTMAAINAIIKEGGKIAFIASLVDRQEGGRKNIEALGYRVVSAYTRDDLLAQGAQSANKTEAIGA
jgi:orotate phosphoribosyltransferase